MIEELKQSYAESQAEEQVDFESRINSLADEVSSFANYTELKRLEKASAHAQQVKVRLAQADEDAKMFNSREALFEKDITSYAQINKMKKQYVTRENDTGGGGMPYSCSCPGPRGSPKLITSFPVSPLFLASPPPLVLKKV